MTSTLPIAYIRTSVKALIVRDDRVLVVREKVVRDGQEVVIHDFPGGGIELGEDLVAALQREVAEEVGLQIISQRVVGAWQFLVPRADTNDAVQIVCIGYKCQIDGHDTIDITRNPAEGENIFETEWIRIETLLAQPELFDSPDMLEALRHL